jgi:hypothetical protein
MAQANNEMVLTSVGHWNDSRLNNVFVDPSFRKPGMWRVTERQAGNFFAQISMHKTEAAAVKAAQRLANKLVQA